jgi:hypothetical protein
LIISLSIGALIGPAFAQSSGRTINLDAFRERFNQIDRNAAERINRRGDDPVRPSRDGAGAEPVRTPAEVGQGIGLCDTNPSLPQCLDTAAQ